ncbi:MAG: hypothetical protein RB296_12200 [Acidobacteriota bacterium]|jgi:hypothetical protein|nr:hypothetical protein [Acidobacteriota bacterium]
MITRLQNWLYRIFGIDEQDTVALERQRKRKMLLMILVIALITTAVLGILAAVQSDWILAGIDLVMLLALAGVLIAFQHGVDHELLAYAGLVITGTLLLALLAHGGPEHASHMWSFVFPVISLFLLGVRKGTRLALFFLLLVALIFLLRDSLPQITRYSWSFSLRFISAYATVLLICMIMEALRKTAFSRLEELHARQENLVSELQEKIAEVRSLRGILPICSHCKKVRNDKGYWEQVEMYIQTHSDARFSHGICPECAEKLYPELRDSEKRQDENPSRPDEPGSR